MRSWSPSHTLTDVPGVRVGHWTDPVAMTGVTVIDLPEPNVAAVEVRGAAPGSRETALLAPGMRVETIQALVLTGGSAFGLASADGVVRALEADGRGHPTPVARVPIVPAAVVFDLLVGDASVRPGPIEGEAAYRAASTAPVPQGNVGAGTGAVVAGWRGFAHARKGGVGSAAVDVDEATVGAIVVLNAVGDVFTLDGAPLSGGPPIPPPRPTALPDPGTATTLVAIVTDAAVTRTGLSRMIVRAHDALAACLRPSHTRYDGDAVFAVSAGPIDVDADELGEAAFFVTGRAIEAVARHGAPLGGIEPLDPPPEPQPETSP